MCYIKPLKPYFEPFPDLLQDYMYYPKPFKPYFEQFPDLLQDYWNKELADIFNRPIIKPSTPLPDIQFKLMPDGKTYELRLPMLGFAREDINVTIEGGIVPVLKVEAVKGGLDGLQNFYTKISLFHMLSPLLDVKLVNGVLIFNTTVFKNPLVVLEIK